MLRELYPNLITSRVIVNGRYGSTEGNAESGFPRADWTASTASATAAVTVAPFLVTESRVSRDPTAVTKQRPNDRDGTQGTHFVRKARKQLVSTQIQLSTGSAGFLPSEARFAFRISGDYAKKKNSGSRGWTANAILHDTERFPRASCFLFFAQLACLINVPDVRNSIGDAVDDDIRVD